MSTLISTTAPFKASEKPRLGEEKEREGGEESAAKGIKKVVLFYAHLSSSKRSKQSLRRSGWNKRRERRSIPELQTAHAESGSTAASVCLRSGTEEVRAHVARLLLGRGAVLSAS